MVFCGFVRLQVPAAVAHSEFWQRYFYKVFQLDQVIMLFYIVYSKLQTLLKVSCSLTYQLSSLSWVPPAGRF